MSTLTWHAFFHVTWPYYKKNWVWQLGKVHWSPIHTLYQWKKRWRIDCAFAAAAAAATLIVLVKTKSAAGSSWMDKRGIIRFISTLFADRHVPTEKTNKQWVSEERKGKSKAASDIIWVPFQSLHYIDSRRPLVYPVSTTATSLCHGFFPCLPLNSFFFFFLTAAELNNHAIIIWPFLLQRLTEFSPPDWNIHWRRQQQQHWQKVWSQPIWLMNANRSRSDNDTFPI